MFKWTALSEIRTETLETVDTYRAPVREFRMALNIAYVYVYVHYAYRKKNHPHSSPNALTIGQGERRIRGGDQACEGTSEELLLKLKCW